jgi:heparanase
LSAEPLENSDVKLNGKALKLGDHDDIPPLEGMATAAGSLELAPTTITFLSLERAGNDACR